MPNYDSSTIGRLAENAAVRKYGGRIERNEWHDMRHANGSPADVKACHYRHSDGRLGRFRLWERAHERLREERGGYVFVVYRRTDSGHNLLKIERMGVREVDRRIGGAEFYSASHSGKRDRQLELEWPDVLRWRPGGGDPPR